MRTRKMPRAISTCNVEMMTERRSLGLHLVFRHVCVSISVAWLCAAAKYPDLFVVLGWHLQSVYNADIIYLVHVGNNKGVYQDHHIIQFYYARYKPGVAHAVG
jgi:hypothetical protein